MNEIFHRVSVRKFEQKPVEREKLLQILRAGMQAPSTGDQRPWEFYVVTDREKILALSKCQKYAGCAANAPAVIVPVYRKEGVWLPEYEQIDMAIAQENIWLETDSLGLGGVWLGIAPQKERMDKVAEILNLPDNVTAFSLFALGYPAERHAQEDRFDASRIHFVE
ncbi:MAG: nitroreductase family protein [Clostridia bacterium]|nr:nitroreductase family protein [Clostridia bacterium]